MVQRFPMTEIWALENLEGYQLSTRHSVLKVITIGWSHFQSASNKPFKIVSNLVVWATITGGHLSRKPTASPVLTKCWNWELILATNFGSHAQMVTKFGGQILATKFGFVPDCWPTHLKLWHFPKFKGLMETKLNPKYPNTHSAQSCNAPQRQVKQSDVLPMCALITHCGLVAPHGIEIWVNNHWLRYVAWWHQAITWTIMTYHQWASVAFKWDPYHRKGSWMTSIPTASLNVTL